MDIPPRQLLPHAGVQAADNEPIVIGTASGERQAFDLLINLAGDLPEGWQGYQRLAEVVDPRTGALPAARDRFRQYRSAGYEPHYHKLGKAKR
nr:DNA polymerase III subunit chi [Alkalilimnicola ehrlichii]